MLWPAVTLASLLILLGATGNGRPALVAAGFALTLGIFGLSLYLATRRWRDRPAPREMHWAMWGLAAFYVAIGVAAGTAGLVYAVAGLAAGIIPLTALALMVATTRREADQLGIGEPPDHAEDSRPGVVGRNERLERAHRRRVRADMGRR
jgi:uncharacterized membrane protein YhaH (DUF805 family)